MEFGFVMPSLGPMANKADITSLAQYGEIKGCSYLSAPDHIIIPEAIESPYPYSQTGEFPLRAHNGWLDQLTTLTFIAAITDKARLLTSVMVVPHRSAVLTAKMLASIDVLSNGRLTVGCGAGWMREEFEAIGAPPFKERGKVTDEFIDVFRELWTKDTPEFNGIYNQFTGIIFEPKPVQKPHPPIWTGGESDAALRRAARLADGWFPIGSNPRYPLDTQERFSTALTKLRKYLSEANRDPASLELAYFTNWYREKPEIRDGMRRAFTGNAEDVANDIGWLKNSGVKMILVNCFGATVSETKERMDHFASEVMSKIGN